MIEPPLGICDRHTGMSGSNPHPLDNGCWVWQPIVPALPSDEEAEPPLARKPNLDALRALTEQYRLSLHRSEYRHRYLESKRALDKALRDAAPLLLAHVSRLEAVAEAARALIELQDEATIRQWLTGDPDVIYMALMQIREALDASVVVPDADG